MSTAVATFSHFFCVPVLILIFDEKVRKLEANGHPKIFQHLQKSSKVLPKVPSGKEFYADPKKSSKIDDFRVG